jgi:threonine/homoserine/homoserine lactone efflux protein
MRPARAPAERPAGKSFRLCGYAFLISFTGSLPVGTLNVSVTDLVIDRHVGAAILFGMGAMLVEVGMVRIALVVVQQLERMSRLLRWFRALACVVILLFAFLSLEAAWHCRKAGVVIPFTGNAPFVSGVVLSLLNPLHLPFWMGWTAVLKAKGLLTDTRREYNVYVLAIGMGTGIAFLVYGIAGHLLILFLRTNQNLFNWLTGIALLVAGLIQLRKTRRG